MVDSMQGQTEGRGRGYGARSAPEEKAEEEKGEDVDHLAIPPKMKGGDPGTERQQRWAARLVIYDRFVCQNEGRAWVAGGGRGAP